MMKRLAQARVLTPGLIAAAVLLLAAPAVHADSPSLNMLSIGISKYQFLPKLLSAHKDARDMADLFRGQKGKLFDNVEVKTLFDANATGDRIRNGLGWVRKQAKADSYTIVFMAGHGDAKNNGEFSFLAVDYQGGNPKGAVSWQELKGALQSLPGKTLLILDSCFAGAVSGGADNLVVLCACQANTISDERAHNGYYTSALLEALSGKADANGDGVVTLGEAIDYVNMLVPQTTKGKQHPLLVRPANTTTAQMPLAQLKTSITLPGNSITP